MGRTQKDLPEPSDLLDRLQKVEKLKDEHGDVIETIGPQIRFVGHECFATEAALKEIKKINPREPRNPAPRDLYKTTGQEENRLPNGDKIPGEFFDEEVIVKYFSRGTGAPIKLKKNKEGGVVSGERVKEYDVWPQEFRLNVVTGDSA